MGVMDVFPIPRPDAANIRRVRKLFLVVVFVKECITPLGRDILEQAGERLTMDVGKRFRVTPFQNAGSNVHVQNEIITDLARANSCRVPNDQWYPDAWLMHAAFVRHAMLTQKHPIIPRVNNDGVVE